MPKVRYVDMESSTPFKASWLVPTLVGFVALGLAIAGLTKAIELVTSVAELTALVNAQNGLFSPGRTLFVAKSWKTGYVPPTHFTDVSSALERGLALSPDQTDPIEIIIYPGDYEEDLTLVSNVYLTGIDQGSVNIMGTVTWNAGIGVNSVFADDFETIYVQELSITHLAINTTGKPSSMLSPQPAALFKAYSCIVSGTSSFLHRLVDETQVFDSEFDSSLLFSGGTADAYQTIFLGSETNVTNSGNLQIFACDVYHKITLVTDSESTLTTKQCFIGGEVFVGNSTILSGSETDFENNLRTDVTGSSSILTSNYNILLGNGPVDRRIFKGRSTTAMIGVNTGNVNPPYITTPYKVFMTQQSGDPDSTPVVLTTDVDQFTYNSTLSLVNYDWVIIL